MTFVLFPLRTYQTAILLLLGGLFITFFHRAEYYDEAWFAEQSYWFIRDGQVRSELFRGYNGWENGIYVFHKLFVYVRRIRNVCYGRNRINQQTGSYPLWLTRWVFGMATRQVCTAREQQWLSIFLYFGCGTLIRYISVNRPETMCMALGFASYLALDPPGYSARPRPILAGLLAGLSALTHLNGIIYLLAGAIWLFVKLGWRLAFLFAIAGALTLSLYGLDAILDGNIALLIKQFLNDPATQQNLHLSDKLSVLMDYHQIFFYGQNEIALTALVILCGIAFRKHIHWTEPVFLYTLLLLISFWLLTKSITDIYFLLFVPWFAILGAGWLVNYLPMQPAWQKRTSQVLLFIYGLITILQFVFVITENRNTADTEVHNSLLASYMPHKQTKVIAPIEFFFGQMDTYKILGLTYYYFLEKEKGTIPLDTFFQRAAQDNVAYIISDHRLNASYDIPLNAPLQIGVYRRVFQDSLNTIYARQ